jgi:hypothetical protein
MTPFLDALRDALRAGAWMPLGVIIGAIAWAVWYLRRGRAR